MSKSSIWARVKLNEKKPCKITTCKNMRVKMNGFCGMHQRRVERWGHPKGYAWQKRLIDPYLEKAEEFVQEHREHRAVKAGVDYLNHALATAVLRGRWPRPTAAGGGGRAGCAVVATVYSRRTPG